VNLHMWKQFDPPLDRMRLVKHTHRHTHTSDTQQHLGYLYERNMKEEGEREVRGGARLRK
jgi:hypothetical protein